MLTLYQFPISHYCEKVRWALEYKNLDYKKVNLLPGLHIKQAKKLAGKSSLPILIHNKKIINESSDIISYLDHSFPDHYLTPTNEALKRKAMEWEKFADEELGPDVRSLCYNTLLDHPEIITPYFTEGGPWYGKLFMKFSFPKMSIKMREYMKLNNKNIALINKRLTQAIDKVYERTKDHEFLVEDNFTRADLSVASLLAPLCRPNNYGLKWPDHFPEPLQSTINELDDKLDWVTRTYTQYR